MFQRFTSQARHVVVLAQHEARTMHHPHIGTEHLLLGMILGGEDPVLETLSSLGVSLEVVRQHVRSLLPQDHGNPSESIPFSPRAREVLKLSLREAVQFGRNHIGSEHLLLGLIREGEGAAVQIMVNLGVDIEDVRKEVIRRADMTNVAKKQSETETGSVVLNDFGYSLTAEARRGALDPVIGRDREMGEVMHVLSRRTRSHPVLIGEPGIGKTAIVEGLAQALVRGDVPASIRGMAIYRLDLDTLINAGDGLEANLNKILKEVELRRGLIIFVDEIHALLGDQIKHATTRIISTLAKVICELSVQRHLMIIEGT